MNYGMHAYRGRKKFFLTSYSDTDPFYVKEEFAPSDKTVLLKQQQAAHDLIAPHLRIIQFLTSHFSAIRLSSPHLQRIFHHLIDVTLQRLQHCSGHPLAREMHFYVLVLALNILKYGVGLASTARWRLKDSILSGGLWWFSHQARLVLFRGEIRFRILMRDRWSFGGNRLQIKAEVRLMADVDAALGAVSYVGFKAEGGLQSLTAKQELLHTLLENEQMRLLVWLYPLDHRARHVLPSLHSVRTPQEAYTADPI